MSLRPTAFKSEIVPAIREEDQIVSEIQLSTHTKQFNHDTSNQQRINKEYKKLNFQLDRLEKSVQQGIEKNRNNFIKEQKVQLDILEEQFNDFLTIHKENEKVDEIKEEKEKLQKEREQLRSLYSKQNIKHYELSLLLAKERTK